jgi:hypothetical protein
MIRKSLLVSLIGFTLVGVVIAGKTTTQQQLTIVGPVFSLQTADGSAYTISGAPGTYMVPGTSNGTPVEITVTIPTPGNPPTPPIPPTPPPTPVIAGKMWMVMVVDTSSTAFTALNSPQSTLWKSNTIIASLGAPPIASYWSHRDIKDPILLTTDWGKAATKFGIPCLVVIDSIGNVTPSVLPDDEPSIIAIAKKLRGVN